MHFYKNRITIKHHSYDILVFVLSVIQTSDLSFFVLNQGYTF